MGEKEKECAIESRREKWKVREEERKRVKVKRER